MSKSASLNIRIDPDTKTSAEVLYKSFGITITDAINMFLRQSLIVGGLPFELRNPRYNSETKAAMNEARLISSGHIESKSYHSVKELMEDLMNDSDD
jgi:DNA-damage-inducible protein J